MSSIDTLISNAESRAESYASSAFGAANQLAQFIVDRDLSILHTDLHLDAIGYDKYAQPTKIPAANPVYEPPTSPLPVAPTLSGVGAITTPAARAEPVLNTSGLFNQTAPSVNLADFVEANPDLQIPALLAEMDAIAKPVLQAITIPTLSPISVGAAPTLNLPGFDALPTPDAVRDPVDYAAKLEAKYAQMVPQMQAFVDDKMATWVATYAPEYTDWTTGLQARINAGMNGTVLPDQIEAAMMARARGRAEEEFNSVEQGLLDSYSRRGFIAPPGAVMSGFHNGRLAKASALANQSTDIYIERRKMEVQHLQFVLNLASSQVNSVRQLAISYAGVVGNTMQQAIGYATEIANQLGKVFEHLIARAQLQVSVLGALNAQYEIKLKAAMSGLEGYKLQLEAEKMKKDVEIAQIQFVEAQVKTQETQVELYTALINAVVAKSKIEELQLKGYEIRAEIFKNNTNAKLASFEVYKAALQGDKYKMEGELSKLQVYEALVKTDMLNLEAQVKGVEATQTSNKVKAEIFELGASVYKLDAEVALQKFTAQAEVKKLSESIYGQELHNAIDVFKTGLIIPEIFMNAKIKEYELNVQTKLQEAKLKIEQLQISESAAAAEFSGLTNMASSALGSLNSVASSSISAAA